MRLLKSEKLLPHKAAGEGHFAALIQKEESAEDGESGAVRALRPRVSVRASGCGGRSKRNFMRVRMENLHEAGGMLYALPEGIFDWKDLRVLRAGVRLGEVKNGRFEPSHSLAMCLKAGEFAAAVDLPRRTGSCCGFCTARRRRTGGGRRVGSPSARTDFPSAGERRRRGREKPYPERARV